MCGIAGVIGRYHPEQAERFTATMVRGLVHRGPDDSGIQSWQLGSTAIAFGHTRLSVIDVTESGHQPMAHASERYWITFNGEIYNYKELRSILDPSGTRLRSASDTEVILEAYAQWSNSAFRALRGMFAFALLDRERMRVVLTRDQLGIKPLYYGLRNGNVFFASEVRCLLATDQFSRSIGRQGLHDYLRRGWVPPSAFQPRLLPPGHSLTVDFSKDEITCSVGRYDTSPYDPAEISKDDREEKTAHLRHVLQESVKSHMVADVPIALFLSGGIDSTALLHLMTKTSPEQVKTFTVVFPQHDPAEAAIARQTAARYGADHAEIGVSTSEVLKLIPSALDAMDVPTMDGVNTFLISRAVSSAGIKVALSGIGADELFAGYPSFRRAQLALQAKRIPAAIRKMVADVSMRANGDPSIRKMWELFASDCYPIDAYVVSRSLFSGDETASLMAEILDDSGPEGQISGLFDPINQISALEAGDYMTNMLLRDTDFMSMASGLEVRTPFIDKVVVRNVLSIPGSWKVSPRQPKPLLLAAMRGAVPDNVWNRPKTGFTLPFDSWMRSELREQMETIFRNTPLVEHVGMRPEAVRGIWDGFLQGRLRWSKPWSLFVLMRWLQGSHKAAS